MRHDLERLLEGVDEGRVWAGGEFDDVRRWSYGDVENNGVYYHPNLTHYAHQVFEEVFWRERGITYADLSGRDDRHREARQRHDPPIDGRMTFPVQWLHQWMKEPMIAGDVIKMWVDAVAVADKRIGVRAWVYTESNKLAALVIWLRWCKVLEPVVQNVNIPEWFLGSRRR
ncbi:MAG: hypothetical protein AABN95_21620 [Acidobacteriota bacterium]